MLKFLISKKLWLNIALLFLFLTGGVYAALFYLDIYTHHGESITVPDLKGLTMDQVEILLENKKLQFSIMDSGYTDKLPPLGVIEQDPYPNSKVKENRTIYLTVNASKPPRVRMPDLIDKSLRQALMEMESWGLKQGDITYRPDLAQNAVLAQSLGGQPIAPGTLIPKGSKIDLVLGDGLGSTRVEVPKLLGLTFEEVRVALMGIGFNLGMVIVNPDVTDTVRAFIYRQIPAAGPDQYISLGESIDIFLSVEKPEIPVDSTGADYEDYEFDNF